MLYWLRDIKRVCRTVTDKRRWRLEELEESEREAEEWMDRNASGPQADGGGNPSGVNEDRPERPKRRTP